MPADRIVGSSLRDVIGEDLFEESRVHLEGALAGFRQDFDRTFTSPGEPLHTQVSYVPDVRPDGSVAGFVELATDITSRARMQAQMTELALHDHLTGLLNRRGLSDRLAKALSDLAASGDTLSLMLCDLDDFKRINDEHGHPAGDVVLQATASRIGRLIDSQDFAARIGGDEFVVIARVRDEPARRRTAADAETDARGSHPATTARGTHHLHLGGRNGDHDRSTRQPGRPDRDR